MLDIQTALDNIQNRVSALSSSEYVLLPEAHGRVLAEDIISPIDVPPADNSAMDGYALNSTDLPDNIDELEISQRIPAGAVTQALTKGTAARIFTGSEIPPGADTVVMQENCEAISDTRIRLLQRPMAQQNIRPQGQDIKAGSVILQKGERLKPQHIGLLASIGMRQISVVTSLKVAVISTGDELVEPGEPLQPGQIYNSNLPMLVAELKHLGCEVIEQAIIEDTLEGTINALRTYAAKADLLISTGGVSVGEEDHVKAAVDALGELAVWKIKIKPGKPLAFGHVNNTPFLGLPGNPVSTFVTYQLFAKPLIRKLQGDISASNISMRLPANFTTKKAQSRPEFMRVRIEDNKVERFPNQSSGVLTSICWANALALIPTETVINTGDLIEVFPMDLL